LLSDTDEKITLELAEKQVRITFSDITLTSKVIDGKFPDYERVIPNYTNHLTLNRLTILQALQRAAILSNEKFRGVRFVLTEKICVLSATTVSRKKLRKILKMNTTAQLGYRF